MNSIHRILFAAGLGVFAAACGGKVVVDGLGLEGAGGSGGSGSTTSTGTTTFDTSTGTTTSVSTSISTSVNSTGTGPNCDPSVTCAEAITQGGDPAQLCPGSVSESLYNKLVECICAGPCATSCGANICLGDPVSQPCNECVQSPMGCGQPAQACLNDI